jgi:hypothetical protein
MEYSWRGKISEKGPAGSFIAGFIHFPMGALIVAFHNVWRGWPIILTLIGYGLLLKSLLYFVFPTRGLKSLSRASVDRPWEFIAGGIVSIGLSLLLAVIHFAYK